MSKPELVDTKTQVFVRPRNRKGILEGKRSITEVRDFRDILPAIEGRKENEAILISGVRIIPPGFYSAQNFSKRGGLVTLCTFGGDANKLMAGEITPLKARIDASERHDPDEGPFVGWTWKDPEKRDHIVRPSVVIEGHRLHMHALKSTSIEGKIELREEDYTARDTKLRTIRAAVPSRSGKEKHDVLIEHVTAPLDPRRFVEWTRLDARHECGLMRNDFTFRFPETVTYCPHIVAAYVAHSRRVGNQQGKIMLQPFPLFTEPVLRAYTGLAYHTAIVEVKTKGSEVRVRTRPLSFPEIDAILMDTWLVRGNKATFFVKSPTAQYKTGPPPGQRPRMRNYNWSTNAPGMSI